LGHPVDLHSAFIVGSLTIAKLKPKVAQICVHIHTQSNLHPNLNPNPTTVLYSTQ